MTDSLNRKRSHLPSSDEPNQEGLPGSLGNQKEASPFQQLGLFAVILGDLIGFTGLGGALGYWLKAELHASDWVMVLGFILGLVGAFYRIYRVMKKELR
ncbi:MAG: AtpZ/AtpI family protein [Bdellovibrionia bacterium]